jgi:hypothetical protein
MESGVLVLGVNVGLLNFFGGYSVGSKGTLNWQADSGGLGVGISGKNKRIPAQRCGQCGTVVFQMT